MKKFYTAIAVMLSISIYSQQIYFVTESGNGSKDGSSWSNASNELSSIVHKAQSGDSVWVAAGSYQGGFIMKDGVSVLGGFSGNETRVNDRKFPGSNQNSSILDGNSNFRVLSQNNDFLTPTVWDGFVIQNGISQMGAGVYLRKNGIIRRCIIRDNSTSLPSVGDYISAEGGVVFRTDIASKKVWIIAENEYGRSYHIYEQSKTNINDIQTAIQDMNGKTNSINLAKSRPFQAITQYRGGNKSDWYIPSAGEWAVFLSLNEGGSFKKNTIYHLVDSTLVANGKTSLKNKRYWSSTANEYNGISGMWYADFGNETINKMNIWQYNKIRGVRYYTAEDGAGKGGGVYATAGSRIECCLITNNNSSLGSGIYARGEVILVNNSVVGNILNTSTASSSTIDGSLDVKVYNTVVAGNTHISGNIDKISGYSYDEYSAVEASYITSGSSNILLNSMSEAQFTNVDAGDYSLLSTSPLSGAGNIAYIPEMLDTDLANNTFIINGKVSIGAYQTGTTALTTNMLFSDIKLYPNPIQKDGQITINLNTVNFSQEQAMIELCDILGRKLISKQAQQINYLQMPKEAGVYILIIVADKQIKTEYKLIVTE